MNWHRMYGTFLSLTTMAMLCLTVLAPSNQVFASDAHVDPSADSATIQFELGKLNRGIAAQDGNLGTGYLMYSAENLFTRFADAPPNGSNGEHLIAVRLVDDQWQYDRNTRWIPFTPTTGDQLLATINFTDDTMTSLQGNLGIVNGIASGYIDGDLRFFANQFNGRPNAGEFEVTGTSFTTQVNVAHKIAIGVRPQMSSQGVAVVEKENHIYLTFHSTKFDDDDVATEDGLTVIQVCRCADRKSYVGPDPMFHQFSAAPDSLDVCDTFEVANSRWAETDEGKRHFVITFLGFDPNLDTEGAHYEFLAESIDVKFVGNATFEEVLLYIDSLEQEG